MLSSALLLIDTMWYDVALAQRIQHLFVDVALTFAGSTPALSIHFYWLNGCLPWSGRFCSVFGPPTYQ